MRKVLRVARREYVETVKTRTFLLGLLVVPIIIGGIIFFGRRMERRGGGPRPAMRVAVTTTSRALFEKIETAVQEHNTAHSQSPIDLQTIRADESGHQQKNAARSDCDGASWTRTCCWTTISKPRAATSSSIPTKPSRRRWMRSGP